MEHRDGPEITDISIRAYAVAVFLGAAMVLYFWLNCSGDAGNAINFEKQININTACGASIERLPRIGEKLSTAIIDYREQAGAASGQTKVFKNLQDLDNVKGIGPKTLERLGPFIKFE